MLEVPSSVRSFYSSSTSSTSATNNHISENEKNIPHQQGLQQQQHQQQKKQQQQRLHHRSLIKREEDTISTVKIAQKKNPGNMKSGYFSHSHSSNQRSSKNTFRSFTKQYGCNRRLLIAAVGVLGTIQVIVFMKMHHILTDQQRQEQQRHRGSLLPYTKPMVQMLLGSKAIRSVYQMGQAKDKKKVLDYGVDSSSSISSPPEQAKTVFIDPVLVLPGNDATSNVHIRPVEGPLLRGSTSSKAAIITLENEKEKKKIISSNSNLQTEVGGEEMEAKTMTTKKKDRIYYFVSPEQEQQRFDKAFLEFTSSFNYPETLRMVFPPPLHQHSKIENGKTDHAQEPKVKSFKDGLISYQMKPDYGHLDIVVGMSDPLSTRLIREDEDYNYKESESSSDSIDAYYAFDDDYLRGTKGVVAERNYQNPNCHRTQQHRLRLSNCNEVHQMDRSDPASHIKYINHGAFREVFSLSINHGNSNQNFPDKLAIKEIVYDQIDDEDDDTDFTGYLEYVRMDAIVAERLTASPRTYDIYGYCGLTIASEFFYHGDIEAYAYGDEEGEGWMPGGDLQDEDDLKPQNNLTPPQKLALALDMVEGLADLHGFEDGLIIHDDVQLPQFLLSKDRTRLKLNDFNRAEFQLWNGESYCRHENGKGHGTWRAPEEYKDKPLTEGIDVWSVGNNMYALLTGLRPFYDVKKRKDVRDSVVKGKQAYIDPRWFDNSPEEHAVAKAIQMCFTIDAEKRATIFEIDKLLQDAFDEHVLATKGLTRGAVIQTIEKP